jgi:hypothetical protein
MFEIWRHPGSGERFLVVVREGQVNVAAGPLSSDDDPREVLETHGNQAHNPRVLLNMRRAPQAYVREYTSNRRGQAVPVVPSD